MKGALSQPDSVLYDTLSSALFPDTTYFFESGGVPDEIPSLTYEQFLDTHQRHYRPDNSYIILYGNVDIDVFLRFLNEKYLNAQFLIERPKLDINPLVEQAPVEAFGVKKHMVTAKENACAACGFVVGNSKDRLKMVAADILIDAIMGSNEAPMKRALLDSGISNDVHGYLADAVLQPFVVIEAKGTKDNAESVLFDEIQRQAQYLSEGGLDREVVKAALSHAEFVMREHNFGYADGVIYAMSAMCGWLYDDASPLAYIKYIDDLATLQKLVDEGYFESLIKEIFITNRHRATVSVVPVDAPEISSEQVKLQELLQSCSSFDLEQIRAKEEKLREVQLTNLKILPNCLI
jgi:hypothetical protein